MARILGIWLVLLLASVAHGADVQVVQLVRVVDGDTIVVNIQGWPEIVGLEIGVRVAGCDTPELRDKRPEIRAMAYRARDMVAVLLGKAQVVELRNISRGKYFRLVADVYADGINIARVLIDSGLAQPYDGGRKPVW